MKKALIIMALLPLFGVSLFAQSKQKLAMVSFTGNNITTSEAQSLFNMFASELTRTEYSKDFILLTRNEDALSKAYGELKFQRNAMLNESQMSRVGQQLGADWVFYGTVTDFGGANVTINILDVETAIIVASVSIIIPSIYDINIKEMTKELVKKTSGTSFLVSGQHAKQQQQELLEYYNKIKWVGRGLWIGGLTLTTVGALGLIVGGSGGSGEILAISCMPIGAAAIISGITVDVIYSMRQKNLENEIKYGFLPYILPEIDINGQFNGNLNMGAMFTFSYKF